jgi:pyruvate/2-oxoglutarate dehydrogenase complex dihydrolipoamide dehydrogenase (E3) component
MTAIESTEEHPPEQFDLVILGSGEGSKFLAWTLARQGQRVAVVEQRWIGGSCPNIACLPSKNIIHSAKVASLFARAEEFGIQTSGYRVDMAGVTNRKRTMVKGLLDIHVRNFETSGVHLICGHGYFVGPKLIRVDLQEGGTRHLYGEKVVIGTGTHAALDVIPGLREAKPLTHIEALELNDLPEHLVVMGGGFIGLEFAQAMRRLGSKVSILDRNAALLHREDPDASSAMESLFRDEGIELILDATVQEVRGTSGDAVSLTYRQQGEEKTVQASHLLVATGRIPNTSRLGLELAGVEVRTSRT